tara:strand:+ start:522 stop:1274 length:753 start_codon:yes stop_codon:yes gene_type:complete
MELTENNIRKIESNINEGKYSLYEKFYTNGSPSLYLKIYKILKKRNNIILSVKNNGKSKRFIDSCINQRKLKLTKEELYDLYWVNKFNMNEIAKKYYCTPATVLNTMNRLGIKRRNNQEANLLMYEKYPEKREKHRQNANNGLIGIFKKGNKYKNFKIEREFKNWCEKNFIEYEWQYQLKDGGHNYDFKIGENILIEVDGLYWHEQLEQKKKDRIFEMEAFENGFKVIRFTDKEIKKTKSECFNILLDIL